MLKQFKCMLTSLRTVFLSGLFTVIPIAATLFFISFMYGLVAKMLLPLRHMQPFCLQSVPGSEFVLVMLVILSIGIVLKVFIMNKLVDFLENLVNRIPLVRIVYSASKIVVDFFKASDSTLARSRKVVLIPYPRKGQYHLAFLLESAQETYEPIIPEHFKQTPDERYVKVFMPNSPNPTTGYFFIMPEAEVINTDISFEEALKTLVSCGLITPESLLKKK
jgi:uncharacterized membrane protein